MCRTIILVSHLFPPVILKLERSTPAPHRQEGCRFDSPRVLSLRLHSKDMHVSPPGSSEPAVGLTQSANGCLAFNVAPVRTCRLVQSVTPGFTPGRLGLQHPATATLVHASVLADIRKAQENTADTDLCCCSVQPTELPAAGWEGPRE